MTAPIYTRAQQTVRAKFAQFGRELPLTRASSGGGMVFDEDTQQMVPGAGGSEEATQNVLAMTLPANAQSLSQFDEGVVNGTLIESDIRVVKIAPLKADGTPLDWVPEAGHTIEFDGDTWTLVGVTPVAPQGVVVVFNTVVQR